MIVPVPFHYHFLKVEKFIESLTHVERQIFAVRSGCAPICSEKLLWFKSTVIKAGGFMTREKKQQPAEQ